MSTVQLRWKSCSPPSDPNTYTLSVFSGLPQGFDIVRSLYECGG